MTKNALFKNSLYFTGAVTAGMWLLLLWNHFHGGVPSYHLLHRKELPAISDWWSGLVLPLLTLFLTYRIQKRQDHSNGSKLINVLYRFLFALLFGTLLSVFFTLGISNVSGYMFSGVLILALFLPTYRAECLLGFVIGMTYTFGAVLSSGIGAIFALIGFILYQYIRTGIIFVINSLKSL